MHWKTYNRIIDKIDRAESRLDFAFIQHASAFFASCGS
jgi:hypothetical protein